MRVIDSHTEGEPTRVILEGGPDLGGGSLAERAKRFAAEQTAFRDHVLAEPRGADAMVAALPTPATDPNADAGVIYFNRVGPLGMCGHATIGFVETLRWLGRVENGRRRIETPVGVVDCDARADGRIAVENVVSRRARAAVRVETDGFGAFLGDVAYGGNWFFLCWDAPRPLRLDAIAGLSEAAWAIRRALVRDGVRGDDGGEIDHVMFIGPSDAAGVDARNFTHCPSGAYDRSPCGTGVSALLACLAADGRSPPGGRWVQESVTGGRYEAWCRPEGEGVRPTVLGRAFVTAETTLIREPDDPYRDGIAPQ